MLRILRSRTERAGLLCLAVGLMWLSAVCDAAAQNRTRLADTPGEPFLRIETGTHTGMINRVSVDAAGRLAATASDDKTVRLWRLPEGRPAGVLRVPIGPDSEGSLYAVAMTPDGRSVAAAGLTGRLWDGTGALYLFDVATQRIKARLTNLPADIVHMSFSPDGRRLAVAFGAGPGAGLTVYDAATGRPVGQDHDYGSLAASWVAFDRAGRIATAALDGFVRLYDPQGRLLLCQKPPNAGRPYSVAFSPDGALLAVGSIDKARVDILSATDLKPRFAPDVEGAANGNLAAVAWLTTGAETALAAGGTAASAAGDRIIRVWPASGMGTPVDIAAAKDSITQLHALPGGQALFTSAAPSWGRIDMRRKVMEVTADIADFRQVGAGRFALSDDGLVLEFGLGPKGQRPMRLDLRLGSYAPARTADPSLATPVVTSAAVKVAGLNGKAPTLNGRRLDLEGEERALSAAVAPDERSLLLGSDYWLRRYDAQGRLLARVSVPAAVGGIVIARGGRLAAAALTDGTIHWYALDRGEGLKELASLFPHPDGERWVAWTPEGFFDHAAGGGKELVGYHFNKGKARTPEWISFEQVYLLFHSSDLLRKKILGGYDDEIRNKSAALGDVRSRLEQRPLPGLDLSEYCWTPPGAAEECRPIADMITRGFARDTGRPAGPAPDAGTQTVVRPTAADADGGPVAALPDGTTDLKLRFRITDRGGGVGGIAVYLNKRNIDRQEATRAFRRDLAGPGAGAGQAAPTPAGETFERTVQLDPGDNSIEIRVYDGANSAHIAREIQVRRVAPPPVAQEHRGNGKPRLFVLAAGVNRYKDERYNLNLAVQDANSFAETIKTNVETLKASNAGLYDKVMVPVVEASGDIVFREAKDGPYALADQAVSRENLDRALTALGKRDLLTPADTVLIYLSGHGVALAAAGLEGEVGPKEFFFITADVDGPDPETVRRQALSQKTLLDRLAPINLIARNLLLLLDTCHSGTLAESTQLDSIAKLNHEGGIAVLSAAASEQLALDGYRQKGTAAKNGVFAHAVISGLSGRAKTYSDVIVTGDLGNYVMDAVPQLAKEVSARHNQRAEFRNLGSSRAFPLVKVPESGKQQ